MAGDVAMAAVVAFSVGVMSGMVATIVVALRQDRGLDSPPGQYLEFLDRAARRFVSTGLRQPTVHPDGQ